jgi:hypothetical protein
MRLLRAVVTVLVFAALTAISWAVVDLTQSPPPAPVETIELDTAGDPAPRKPRKPRKERPDDPGASGGSGGAPPAPAPAPAPAGDDDVDDDDDGDSDGDSG